MRQDRDGGVQVYASVPSIALDPGRTYQLRVDRSGATLVAWVSADGGRTWREVTTPRPQLASGAARGTWLGFVAAAALEHPGDVDARFDNLQLWRAGDVSPP